MTYLIAQIWVFLAVASALGLLFGWMFRGGVSAARLKDVRRELAHTQVEAADQRREATELAARVERRGSGSSAVDSVRLESELRAARSDTVRLESELREAASTVHRHSAEADELRQRLADASGSGSGAKAKPAKAEPVDTAELENLRIQVRELEFESEDLRHKLDDSEASSVPTVDDTAPLQARVAELESELERAAAAPAPEPAPNREAEAAAQVATEAALAAKAISDEENKTLRSTQIGRASCRERV